jgi:hypothetical protein
MCYKMEINYSLCFTTYELNKLLLPGIRINGAGSPKTEVGRFLIFYLASK